jgi:hypothetical protein
MKGETVNCCLQINRREALEYKRVTIFRQFSVLLNEEGKTIYTQAQIGDASRNEE